MFPWTELHLENAITWTPRANWIKASLPGCRALIHLHWISLIPIIYLQLKIALNFVWSLCENQFRHATLLSYVHSNPLLSKNVWLSFFQHLYCQRLHEKKVNNKVLDIIIYICIYKKKCVHTHWPGFVWHWCLFKMKREKMNRFNDRAVLSILRYIAVLSSYIY